MEQPCLTPLVPQAAVASRHHGTAPQLSDRSPAAPPPTRPAPQVRTRVRTARCLPSTLATAAILPPPPPGPTLGGPDPAVPGFAPCCPHRGPGRIMTFVAMGKRKIENRKPPMTWTKA